MKETARLPSEALCELESDEDLIISSVLLKDQDVNQIHVNIEVLPLAVESPTKVYMLDASPIVIEDVREKEQQTHSKPEHEIETDSEIY
ncbi:hypothetical protein FNV43_RR15010 [Rhamnella rubrinervis]|uniref:Uncharacterized protein n=1 Tax=Rhamnella rubrinervis TaxID=2594499 RepID=A0A8K0GY87_9ROSA|nr:hypothetical protein FNV43_RR15010 [Rhamnella rubrinervis]